VCTLPTEADGILRTDFLVATEALLDLVNQRLVMKQSRRSDVAFTIFAARDGQSGQSVRLEERNGSISTQRPGTRYVNLPRLESRFVETAEMTRLAPCAKRTVTSKSNLAKRRGKPHRVCAGANNERERERLYSHSHGPRAKLT
jgi:hypothetical protein